MGVSFDFEFSYLLHNNLGGQGPDTTAGLPPTIRFVNAGVVYHPVSGNLYFDIELNATTPYTPATASSMQMAMQVSSAVSQPQVLSFKLSEAAALRSDTVKDVQVLISMMKTPKKSMAHSCAQ